LLQPEGQTGEAWHHLKKQWYSENRGTLKRKVFSLYFIFPGLMQVVPVLARLKRDTKLEAVLTRVCTVAKSAF
jgi:hypothetical protein